MDNKKPGPNLKKTSSFMKYSSMGIQMMLTILLFVLAGRWADKAIGWRIPVFTLVLSLAGVAGSMYYFIRKL